MRSSRRALAASRSASEGRAPASARDEPCRRRRVPPGMGASCRAVSASRRSRMRRPFADPRASDAGARRNTARGRWRSTIITNRSVPGTQTTALERAMPRTVASATASAVTESGAGRKAGGHLRLHESRSHDHHVHAAARERGREPLVVAVDAGLRRAVHEVRAAHALAGDRREQHQRSVALLAEPSREGNAHRHRTGIVRLHDLERGRGILLGAGLITEHAERDEDEVEVAETIERVADERPRARRSRSRRRRTACTSDAPAVRSSAATASHVSGLRTASTTRAARCATSLRTVATPRSEVPPSTSTDCTVPRASFTIASFRLR